MVNRHIPNKLYEIKASNAIAISEEVFNQALNVDVNKVFNSILQRFTYQRMALSDEIEDIRSEALESLWL